jgi:hypothetical protein
MPIERDITLNVEDKESLADFFRKKDEFETIFTKKEKKKITHLEFDNRFYGRIDTKNNSVFVDTSFLSAVYSNKDIRLLDIPAQAYVDLQTYFRTAFGRISRDSYFTDLYPDRGYISVHEEYQVYMQEYFTDFVSYISKEQDRKITDIKKFFDLFIDLNSKFISIQEIPFTRTGFLQSIYCSPYVSGLVVDVKTAEFNNDQVKYDDYIKDINFEFFLESANRFGFLVDKNAPWRLIFNTKQSLMSAQDPDLNLLDQTKTGLIDLCGYTIQDGYFARNGITDEESFYDKRYIKSMIGRRYDETSELELLKFMFTQFYNGYIFPNREVVQGKESIKNKDIFIEKTVRNVISIDQVNETFGNEVWLRLLLYFRALETKQRWNQLEFEKYYNASIAYYKTYNIRSAIDFINSKTSNLFDVDKTNLRAIDRERLVNKVFTQPEQFKF